MKSKSIKVSDVEKYLNYLTELKKLSEAGKKFLSGELQKKYKVHSAVISAAQSAGVLRLIGKKKYVWTVGEKVEPIHARRTVIELRKYLAKSALEIYHKKKDKGLVKESKSPVQKVSTVSVALNETIRELYLFGIPIYKKVQKTTK